MFSKTFVNKEDFVKLDLDVNHISQKTDNYSVNAKSDLLTLSSNLTEKMRLIQQETIERADAKYVLKELEAQKTRQQEERMNKFESKLNSLECILADVKTTGDVNASKLDSIIAMLNQE